MAQLTGRIAAVFPPLPSTLSLALLALAAPAGCLGPITFECDGDASCGPTGVCEEASYCSFPDDGCVSRRRYGMHAGPVSGQCVGDPVAEESAGDAPSSDPTATGEIPGSHDTGPATGSGPTDSTSTAGASGDSTTSDGAAGSTGSAGSTSVTISETSGSTSDGDTGAPARSACTDAYGNLTANFDICIENSATCRFGAQTGRGSCDALCQSAGGMCLHAWNNIDGTTCMIDPVSADDCSLPLFFQICECTLPVP